MVHCFGQLRGSNYRCGGHGIRSDWSLLTRNTLRVFESRAFHSSPPPGHDVIRHCRFYCDSTRMTVPRGYPRGTRHPPLIAIRAFQFRRTFRRHRSPNPTAVNRCNYASQLTATVNNARPLLNPSAFKILIERGMRPWYFASFVHRIWMNLPLVYGYFAKKKSPRDEVIVRKEKKGRENYWINVRW